MRNRPSVYIAAPLFSSPELRRNQALRDSLADSADVYLPQEDGSLLIELVASGMSPQEAKIHVFRRDIMAIEQCDVLVLIMDGRTIDEGACFELGYAFSRGKACVGIKTDPRVLLTLGDNPMIECALREKFSSDDDFVAWIRSGAWRTN